MIRRARDEDAEGLIGLIASCFAEYPGCVLDVDGEEPELRAIARAYDRLGGRFWVAESEGTIVGSVGVVPTRDEARFELRKLYVASAARRKGLATRLCGTVEQEALSRGGSLVELWSDTRFLAAHALYRRLGYRDDGRTRELHDLSGSVELHFVKSVG